MIRDGDRICSRELRIFSLNPKTFRDGINWHKDYYSGYVWPLKPFSQIYDKNDSGIDLNVTFEMSRLQFIPTLIQAFECTKNDRYLNQLAEILDSWIESNPYCFGVNWWSCMEVGLRAVNMILAIGWLANRIEKQKLNQYMSVLWQHALYIHKYEVIRDPVRNKNNHFLASMLGLLAVSMCFSGNRAIFLRQFAVSALQKEIPRQFHDDGGNFESATAYHQFSLEVVLVFLLLLKVFQTESEQLEYIGKDLHERLVRALNLVNDYMCCFGQSPNIGDSSDCRVIVFRDYFDRKPADHSFLLYLAETTFRWKSPKLGNSHARVYPKSGYASLQKRLYGLIAFAGPKGTNGSGGHGHNDKGSFVLQVRGIPILIDSGTYIYKARSLNDMN